MHTRNRGLLHPVLPYRDADNMQFSGKSARSLSTDVTYLYFGLKTAGMAVSSSDEYSSTTQLLLSLAAEPVRPGGACLLLAQQDGSFVGRAVAARQPVEASAFRISGGSASISLAEFRRYVLRDRSSHSDSGVYGVPEHALYAVLPVLFCGELEGALLLWGHDSSVLTDQAIEHAEALATLHGALLCRERLAKMSRTDELTGVHNYRALAEALGTKRKSTEPFSVILVELDDFKQVNNVHGHRAGNRVLQEVSDILRKNARSDDYVTRLGGDEFAVLLHGQDKKGARLAAERFRNAIGSAAIALSTTQPAGKITVSIGIASYPEDGKSPEEVLDRADDAVYHSKMRGKNRVTLYEEGMVRVGGDYHARKILGTVDPVSGLYDRTYMLEQLAFQVSIAKHFGRCVWLGLLDIDDFRLVNEEYGPSVGDHVIRELALIVIKRAADSLYVCRHQGDEIAVIMPGVSAHDASEHLSKIIAQVRSTDFGAAVAESGESERKPLHITLSAGLAGFPEDAISAQDLLMKSGLALLRAKQRGRGSVCVYEGDER